MLLLAPTRSLAGETAHVVPALPRRDLASPLESSHDRHSTLAFPTVSPGAHQNGATKRAETRQNAPKCAPSARLSPRTPQNGKEMVKFWSGSPTIRTVRTRSIPALHDPQRHPPTAGRATGHRPSPPCGLFSSGRLRSPEFAFRGESARRLVATRVTALDDNRDEGMDRFFNRASHPKHMPARNRQS